MASFRALEVVSVLFICYVALVDVFELFRTIRYLIEFKCVSFLPILMSVRLSHAGIVEVKICHMMIDCVV